MHPLSRFEVIIAAAVLAGRVATTLAGLPQALGAHPWWAGTLAGFHLGHIWLDRIAYQLESPPDQR